MTRRRGGWIRAVGWLGAFLVSLSLVVWRQSAGVALERELRTVEAEASLIETELHQLERDLRALEARNRVVRYARDELGMRMPNDNEVVILPLRQVVNERVGRYGEEGR